MSSPEQQRQPMARGQRSIDEFGRILLVLDVTSDATPALKSAASLASRLDAPLLTLFVDDGRLEQLERHPSARAIELPTGLGRSVETGSMQRSWRALARRTQRRLAELARRHRLEAQFELLRGEVNRRLREFSDDSDLMVVASSGRNLTRHVRVRSRCYDRGCRLPGSVVFVGSDYRGVNSVVAVYDGSPQSMAGLDTALKMAAHPNVMLTLLLVGETSDDVEELQQQAAARLRGHDIRVRPHVRRITCCDTDQIVRTADNVHANFVVVPATDDYPGGEDIDELTRQLDCPVLVLQRRESTPEDIQREIDDEATGA